MIGSPRLTLDYTMLPLAPKNAEERKKQSQRVLRRLKADYSDAECALRFDSNVQLLIATILSAQCTDKRVNIVTARLFADCPTAQDMAALPIRRLEKYVQSTGFFRNKAKNIKACCRVLVEKHDGEVPQDLDSLVQLAGVGRKTANVVLGTGFGIASGVVVDTHVGRISRRTGLTRQTDPGSCRKRAFSAASTQSVGRFFAPNDLPRSSGVRCAPAKMRKRAPCGDFVLAPVLLPPPKQPRRPSDDSLG